MLAPFSAPSRGIAILILPGGPLRFQIGEVTGVSTLPSQDGRYLRRVHFD
jgi:hypothetical protein